MASEHSDQGGRNRLLAALSPADHSLLAPHLNVVGAMSGFGVSQSSTKAVVQAPLMASRISNLDFRKAFQKSEGIRNLMVIYNEMLWRRFSRLRRATRSTPWNLA
jgi:hypothetical protein